MLSSNTVPYVRHLLYVAKCEAVTAAGTLTDFYSNSNVRNNDYCDDYKVLIIYDNDKIIIIYNVNNVISIINVLDMIIIIDVINMGIIVIIIINIIQFMMFLLLV